MTSFDAFHIGDQLISKVQAQGVKDAEVFAEEIIATHIRAFDGKIESTRAISTQGIGLRVIVDGRRGYSFASTVSTEQLADLAERAISRAHLTQPDSANQLPDAQATDELPGIFHYHMSEIPIEQKIELALATERVTRHADPAIVSTEDVEYFDFDRTVTALSTKGVRNRARHSLSILAATAIAASRCGACQSGTMCSYARDFTKLSVEETTKCAVARAVRVANAHPIRTVEVPIILDPWVAARFVELLAHSVSAEFVRKGRSSLKGRLGELIASPVVSVMDDGGLISSPFAMPFDAEGVSTRKTCVIRDGRVESFLYDTYEACAAKKRSTGNASRASFRDSPVPGKSNLYIIPGSQSSDDIVLSTQRGLYVQELQGIHTANPVSGDFSVGVTGGWIESGEWVHAVRGVTIAGNLFELLQRIDAVGDDLQFFTFPRVLVTCAGSPTLRVASLVVSGN